jgi:hypothetical protein
MSTFIFKNTKEHSALVNALVAAYDVEQSDKGVYVDSDYERLVIASLIDFVKTMPVGVNFDWLDDDQEKIVRGVVDMFQGMRDDQTSEVFWQIKQYLKQGVSFGVSTVESLEEQANAVLDDLVALTAMKERLAK